MSEPDDPRRPQEEAQRTSETAAALEEEISEALSASLDGALSPEEMEALADRLARDPAAAARRERFLSVDASLRQLGEEPIADAALADGLARLRARIAAQSAAEGAAGSEVVSLEAARWRRQGVWIAAAATAAALLTILGLPSEVDGPGEEESAPPRMAEERFEDDVLSGDEEASEVLPEELAVALGYGEASPLVPGLPNEDLVIVEELDVLDFMVAREREAGSG